MEVILWGLHRFTSHEFLNSLTPRSVSLEHLLTLFVIELLEEYAPIRLILLKEGQEFLVHIPSFRLGH